MRIVFVNRFYWPDEQATAQLLTDLAEGLASRGWRVEVLCSASSESRVPREETRHGVTIHRVGSPAGKTVSLLHRSFAFGDFLFEASRFALAKLRPDDLLVTLTDPPMLGACLWPWAKLKGTRQLHWVQDVYPEVAIALFESGLAKVPLKLLLPLRNLALRQSEGAVALGTDMADLLAKAGLPRRNLCVIPNWAPAGVRVLSPEEQARAKAELGLENRFVVLYSGNLGRVHEIDILWQAAAALRSRSEIVFLIVGGGAGRGRLEEAVRREGLCNVRFLPPQARERLSESLSVGDVHLVTLKRSCAATVFPSKLYGIAAAGRPVLFAGPEDCEVAGLVERHGMGRAFSTERVADLAAHVARLADDAEERAREGAQARVFAEKQGLREHAVDRWGLLLETLSRKTSS
jgi:colanic acid biosynthesis glycosyl transferase WcaI